MNLKTVERVLLIFLLVLVLAGVYVGLRNLDYFNVTEVSVVVSGPVSQVSSDMERIINPIKGKNILEVNLHDIERLLGNFDGVKKVQASRYYPNKIIIDIQYNDIMLKAFSLNSGDVNYYFIHDDQLDVVSEKTWNEFDKLGIVELNPAYAQMVQKWGADDGFLNMIVLVEHLNSNNLISSIKYDNNNGSDFGRLVLSLPQLNVQLFVRELVSSKRLDEAIGIIVDKTSGNDALVVFDLYANALVKRT